MTNAFFRNPVTVEFARNPVDVVKAKTFFQNWFDCSMAFKNDNDNTDAEAMRAWARSRADDEAFSRETKAATQAAEQAFRASMRMNNR